MDAVIQLFRNMGPIKLSAIGGAVLFVVIGIILLSMRNSVKEYIPLYSNLDIKDSNRIVTELESSKIPFQLRMNGSEILVPEDKVLRLRMSMAQKGFPSQGSIVGYEIFNNSELLGTSSFVQNVNLVRALEGELSRTISSLSNIDSSRVHLVMPKREIFSREREYPSASIVVTVRGNNNITKDQIIAISNMVATAVPELDVSRITIVDNKGRALKIGSKNKDDLANIVSNNEEIKIAHEIRLKNVIEEMLEQSLGVGHVKAQVSVEMNFDRIVTNSESFDPSGQVVRSVQEIDDKEASSEKESNNVSVANNLPTAGVNNNPQDQTESSSTHTDTTTNYEISKTTKNQISETGIIKKLSIAVLIDGIYQIDKEKKDVTYIIRDPAELSKYESLIKSAVGFNSSRGDNIEVINMQFTSDLSLLKPESPIEWFKKELPSLLQTLIIGIVVILVLLLVVRPIAIRAFESSKVELEDISAAQVAVNNIVENKADPENESTSDQQINISEIDAKSKASNFKSINDVVAKYPQETVGVMKKWMNKE